jgi:predicted nucleic acid-binding protein
MIAIDTNILVYAHREDSSFHKKAKQTLIELAESGKGNWAIPWPCIYEFLAIVTHPKIYNPATPLTTAIEFIDLLLKSPNLSLIGESVPEYWETLKTTLLVSKISGAKVHDARIASICIDNGIKILYTADRDFSRFTNLKTQNPLI